MGHDRLTGEFPKITGGVKYSVRIGSLENGLHLDFHDGSTGLDQQNDLASSSFSDPGTSKRTSASTSGASCLPGDTFTG